MDFLVRVNDTYTGSVTMENFKVLKVYNGDVKLLCCTSNKVITVSTNYIEYMVHSGGFI